MKLAKNRAWVQLSTVAAYAFLVAACNAGAGSSTNTPTMQLERASLAVEHASSFTMTITEPGGLPLTYVYNSPDKIAEKASGVSSITVGNTVYYSAEGSETWSSTATAQGNSGSEIADSYLKFLIHATEARVVYNHDQTTEYRLRAGHSTILAFVSRGYVRSERVDQIVAGSANATLTTVVRYTDIGVSPAVTVPGAPIVASTGLPEPGSTGGHVGVGAGDRVPVG